MVHCCLFYATVSLTSCSTAAVLTFAVYISWSAYVIVLCMIKISLVLFYLEIFKTPRFRMTAYIFLAYMVVNSLAIFGIAIFACNPISSF